MEIFLFWIIFSVLVGVLASSRNRSFLGWMVIAMFFSPLVGFVALLCLKRADSEEEIRAAETKSVVGDKWARLGKPENDWVKTGAVPMTFEEALRQSPEYKAAHRSLR